MGCSICSKKVHAKGLCMKHYRKTKNAFLGKCYRNIRQRCTGVQVNKSHIYLGLEILNKEEFINWSLNDIEFNSLYNNWVSCNFDRTQTPSIDRIDSTKGYVLNNIRWISNSLNSSLGATSFKRNEVYES